MNFGVMLSRFINWDFWLELPLQYHKIGYYNVFENNTFSGFSSSFCPPVKPSRVLKVFVKFIPTICFVLFFWEVSFFSFLYSYSWCIKLLIFLVFLNSVLLLISLLFLFAFQLILLDFSSIQLATNKDDFYCLFSNLYYLFCSFLLASSSPSSTK